MGNPSSSAPFYLQYQTCVIPPRPIFETLPAISVLIYLARLVNYGKRSSSMIKWVIWAVVWEAVDGGGG
jgi:hypothetical protein